ncbi:MAG: Rieske 2Fe-2S domain-containing protein [Acidobacteriota bacterium]
MAENNTETTTEAAVSEDSQALEEKKLIQRRNFFRLISWASIWGFLGANTLMIVRFFFPRILFEPKTTFRIGFPADFGFGVDTRFQQEHRVWVVRTTQGIFVIFAKCTHLGCTPDWVESENKFKCPCHGSGYDTEGYNFEGPAPRPLDRAKVELDAEGQIVVDTSTLYQCPPGAPCKFGEDGSFITV